MATEHGVQLESSDHPPVTAVADINAALAEVGAGVWPLDLTMVPSDVRGLLRHPALTGAETERVRAHFLLRRDRLLEVIQRTGRRPSVPGGGELITSVSNEGYSYPQLWIATGREDFTRFDRFHVNVSDNGIGVDEVLQILSGGGVVIRLRLASGATRTLRLDCPREDAGWLVTYDGGKPHIGSLSAAKPGTKVLVQVIGPARWTLRYEDDR